MLTLGIVDEATLTETGHLLGVETQGIRKIASPGCDLFLQVDEPTDSIRGTILRIELEYLSEVSPDVPLLLDEADFGTDQVSQALPGIQPSASARSASISRKPRGILVAEIGRRCCLFVVCLGTRA